MIYTGIYLLYLQIEYNLKIVHINFSSKILDFWLKLINEFMDSIYLIHYNNHI